MVVHKGCSSNTILPYSKLVDVTKAATQALLKDLEVRLKAFLGLSIKDITLLDSGDLPQPLITTMDLAQVAKALSKVEVVMIHKFDPDVSSIFLEYNSSFTANVVELVSSEDEDEGSEGESSEDFEGSKDEVNDSSYLHYICQENLPPMGSVRLNLLSELVHNH